MERNFYTDDFEDLLKEKADQYKMYPSDKVWNGIQSSLHSRRKWYWIGFALLLSGVSYYAIEALIAPPRSIQKTDTRFETPQSGTIASAVSINTRPTPFVIPLPQAKPAGYVGMAPRVNKPFYGVFNIDRSYSHIEPGATGKLVDMLDMAYLTRNADPATASIDGAASSLRPHPVAVSPYQSPAGIDNSGTNNATNNNINRENSNTQNTGDVISIVPRIQAAELIGATSQGNVLKGSNVTLINTPENSNQAKLPVVNPISNAGVSDNAVVMRFPIEHEPAAEDVKKINWLQEYALAELAVPKFKRFSWQFAFAPTMNYRKLSTSKNPGRQYMVKNIPMAMNITGDLDQLVNHKPALGFELGTHLRYAVVRTVTIKAGIQFNYARYAIEAFSALTTDVATIALNSTGGARRDSLISYSSISNIGGNSVKDIQNQYFQLSAPIGLEVMVIGGKRLQLHVAGTVQPTYLINRNTYLITTDYQSYTHEPSLVRRWNLNTSAEAFVSYNTGSGIVWQVGPQFRYQVLSSYSSKYPIRENLMEYGIKIGVSKTIR